MPYFSTSSGKTENSEEVFIEKLPYLRSVESNWDAVTSPVFTEKKVFNIKNFYNLLGIKNNNKLKIVFTQPT